MLRFALNVVHLGLIGALLLAMGIALAFFASPESVRSPLPFSHDSLLLDQLSNN